MFYFMESSEHHRIKEEESHHSRLGLELLGMGSVFSDLQIQGTGFQDTGWV